MNDIKNLSLAWLSTTSSLLAAIKYRELIAIISAVVLPIIFFTLGKTVDVVVQVYLSRTNGSSDREHAAGRHLNADKADYAE